MNSIEAVNTVCDLATKWMQVRRALVGEHSPELAEAVKMVRAMASIDVACPSKAELGPAHAHELPEKMSADEAVGLTATVGYRRNPDTGMIANPGKFEGEPIYVPYFWEIGQESGDQITFPDGEVFCIVPVTQLAGSMFPDLANEVGKHAVLSESDDGFVSCDLMDAEEFATFQRDCSDEWAEQAEGGARQMEG